MFAVIYQTRMALTALMGFWFFQRTLSCIQWVALGGVSIGVAVLKVQGQATPGVQAEAHFIGFAAVLCACVTSAFCSVYMEKLLKGADHSLAMRNVQLALIGSPIALITAFWQDGAQIIEAGLLQGYDGHAWCFVGLQAFGGLAIGVVLKHADSIVKCFATALSAIASCTISLVLGELQFTRGLAVGSILVVSSTLLYAVGEQH